MVEAERFELSALAFTSVSGLKPDGFTIHPCPRIVHSQHQGPGVKLKFLKYAHRVTPVVARPPKPAEFVPNVLNNWNAAKLGIFVVWVFTKTPSMDSVICVADQTMV